MSWVAVFKIKEGYSEDLYYQNMTASVMISEQ